MKPNRYARPRLAIMAVATDVRTLILAQLLDYGLTQPAVMELLSHAAPELRPRVVSIWTGCQMALCTVAANGLVTLLGRRLCLNEILAWMTLPAALGTLVLLRAPYAKEECSDAG